jgi:hypothetical protein
VTEGVLYIVVVDHDVTEGLRWVDAFQPRIRPSVLVRRPPTRCVLQWWGKWCLGVVNMSAHFPDCKPQPVCSEFKLQAQRN